MIWNTTFVPNCAYADPPKEDPNTDPNALAVQQFPCILPFTFSFFARSTVTQSAQTSEKHIHAETAVIVAIKLLFVFINLGTII